jgi:hypothetical protein
MNVLAIVRRVAVCAAIGTAVLTIAVPVRAHHAYASVYDTDRPVKVEGALKKLEMTNPHGWIYIDVKGPDGDIQEWKFETGNGASLARQGFTKNSVPIGTTVVVEGFMAKGVPRVATHGQMTYPDGRRVLVADNQDGRRSPQR